jgi:diketogulonate reductase-like aldo/keto reductase
MTYIDNPREHRFALNTGDGAIPALGFGTLLSNRSETRNATVAAVRLGFRHLDCAERYRNEEEVGAALKELLADRTVRREDLFITTKLWNNNHRPERVKHALQASLNRLGVDAVDLYLMHTPFAFAPGDDQDPRDAHGAVVYDDGVTLEETWAAMEALVDEGLCRAIGLSDIDVDGAKRIVDGARILPAVVEVESHPYHPQWDLHEFCQTAGIVLLAFAPLGHALEPRLLDDPVIVTMARRYGKTPAQVLLAWGIQRGSAVLTSSVTPARIMENVDVGALPQTAIEEINERLEVRHRFNSVVDAGEPGFSEVPVGTHA